jgi:hypothetical protein
MEKFCGLSSKSFFLSALAYYIEGCGNAYHEVNFDVE